MALDKVKVGVLDGASTGVKSDRHTIPSVTTSERDAGSFSAAVGDTIYNSTAGNLEQYTATGWVSIAAPPSISGITYPTENGLTATALDATGSSDPAQTLLINGTGFTSTVTVEILVGGTYSAFSSSTSVNGAKTQVTCTGVTKRAAADGYKLKVTNSTGLDASTTVNFSADTAFTTAAALGTVIAGDTLNKSIAFTGTKLTQGSTAKPTWMTVTGNTSTAEDGDGQTAFDATGSPAVLGGSIAVPASSANSQVHTFSIIVRDSENQSSTRDFSLTAAKTPVLTDVSNGAHTLFTYASGTHKVYRFTAGTTDIQFFSDMVVDLMVVGGGGGGAVQHSGGGGGGGILYNHPTNAPNPSTSSIIIPAGTYRVIVGDATSAKSGAGNKGDMGNDSSVTYTSGSGSFTTYTAGGGGGGGSHGSSNWAGLGGRANHGSGGGGGSDSGSGGSGNGAGTAGGSAAAHATGGGGGGGGGAGAAGAGGSTSGSANNGGVGQTSYTNGGGNGGAGLQMGTIYDGVNNYYWAAGGGGGAIQGVSNSAGDGGAGGGGGGGMAQGPSGAQGAGGAGGLNAGVNGDYSGTQSNAHGGAGGANTGSGGGSSGSGGSNGGAGGSGIVLIRYAITGVA